MCFMRDNVQYHFEVLSGLQSENNGMIRTNQSNNISLIEPQYLLMRDIMQKTFWYIFWVVDVTREPYPDKRAHKSF